MCQLSMGPPWSWLFPSAPCPQFEAVHNQKCQSLELVIRCEVARFSYNILQPFKHLQTTPPTNMDLSENGDKYPNKNPQNDPKLLNFEWGKMMRIHRIQWIRSPVAPWLPWLCPGRLRPFHQALSFGSSAAVSHHAVVIFLLRGCGKTHRIGGTGAFGSWGWGGDAPSCKAGYSASYTKSKISVKCLLGEGVTTYCLHLKWNFVRDGVGRSYKHALHTHHQSSKPAKLSKMKVATSCKR